MRITWIETGLEHQATYDVNDVHGRANGIAQIKYLIMNRYTFKVDYFA